MIIGGKNFETSGHTYIMGILNVTPDSFSDGGQHNTIEKAIAHARLMVSEGAEIIDVGGESTRPGYTKISDQEEIERVVPVIERIKSELDVPVSIDTYKPVVAKAAIDGGADLINDIWGLQNGNMAEVIARADIPCCLMHNRQTPIPEGADTRAEIEKDIEYTLKLAEAAGISRDKIILDPGVGFAKDTRQNLQVINGDNFMMPDGYPVLLGTSRKSVIGNTLSLPATQRVEGTLVTTVLAVQKGAMFVRVHDVKENWRCIKMMEAIRDC